jgi:hypothetical protein
MAGSRRSKKKLLHEGNYVAEIEVQLIEADEGWSPYLTLDDVAKLDQVRGALRKGDLTKAATLARVFHLTPV